MPSTLCFIMILDDPFLARWTIAYSLQRDIFSKLTFIGFSPQVWLWGQPTTDCGNCFSQQNPGFFVPRAQGGEWQMTMPAGVSALPRGHCQFPFVVQIDSLKVGHEILTPCTALFHGATTNWCFSSWTAGTNSSGQASDFKQQCGRKHV